MHSIAIVLTSFLSVLMIRRRPICSFVPSLLTPHIRPVLRQNLHPSSIHHKSFSSRKLTTPTIAAMSIQYIEIPLLDVSPSNDSDEKKEEILVQPLPSMHLRQQPELTNVHVYGMRLTVPLHQQIINHAWDIAAMDTDPNKVGFSNDYNNDVMMPLQQRTLPYNDPTKVPLVGIMAYKPSPTTAVNSSIHPTIGAIGCVVQVLYNNDIVNEEENPTDGISIKKKKKKGPIPYNTPSTSKGVLCRGLFRFIVRDIKQSIPYTVALVEELHDSNENDNDNDRASGTNMTTTELMQRTLQSMQLTIDRMMENAIQSMNQPLTPLEESILQDNGMIDQLRSELSEMREKAQQYALIWSLFRSTLIDMTPRERYYAVPIMAAEICNFNNTVRRQMLVTINPIERLRIAEAAAADELNTVKPKTSNAPRTAPLSSSTRSNTKSVVSDSLIGGMVSDGSSGTMSSADLTVGTPKLPSWSKKIKKGTVLDYYWNEEYGWCRGQVIEDPLRIVPDEIVLTVHFKDDGTTHRLPFSADEKVRWRPPSSS